MSAIKLGEEVKDTITGFKGIAVARTEWLYGCVRVSVQPTQLHEGKPIESQTFDEPQLVPVKPPKPQESYSGRHGPRPDASRNPDPTR